jgi:micrococcal nuclease
MPDKTIIGLTTALIILLLVIILLFFGYIPDIADIDNNETNNTTGTNEEMSDEKITNKKNFDGLVVDVDDGDTVDVERWNGSVETIRIYGIDTPETSGFGASPSEFGVSEKNSECLTEYGKEAKSFAENKMLGKKVDIIESPVNRGDYDRKLRYIKTNESDRLYGKMVISEGLSRVYDDRQDFPRINEYESLENKAKIQIKGLWNCSERVSGISIYQVQPDSAGDDTQKPTEFVEIANTGNQTVTDITISDDTDKQTTISSIEPNKTIEVHTCEAQDMDDFIWEKCSPIWNNNGDDVTVSFSSDTLNLAY